MNSIMSLLQKLKTNSLLKDAGIYTLFSIVEKLIPFTLLPFLARYLSEEELGVFVVYQTLLSLTLPIISLNCDSAILVNFFKLKVDDFRVYFFSSLIWLLVGCSLAIGGTYIFGESISNITEFPHEWLLLVVFISILSFFPKLILYLWQVEREPKKYGWFSLSFTIAKNGGLFVAVVLLNEGWSGLVYSQLISFGVFTIISLVVLHQRRALILVFNKAFFKDSFKLGAPLTLHQIASWLGGKGNRLIINVLIGSAATGSFGIGSVYGTIVEVIQIAYNKAFAPYLFGKLKNLKESDKPELVKLTYYSNLGLLVLALLISLGGFLFHEIIFGENMVGAKQFILLMSLGNAFNGMYKMHVNYLFFEKKSWHILSITLISGVINLIATYWFVSNIGAIGAAYVFVFTQFLTYLISWYQGNRIVPLPWWTFKTINNP